MDPHFLQLLFTLLSIKKICINEDKSGKLAGYPVEEKIDLGLQLFSTGIYMSKEKDSLVNILKWFQWND